MSRAPRIQTINFTSTNPSPVAIGAPPYTPTATASSGPPRHHHPRPVEHGLHALERSGELPSRWDLRDRRQPGRERQLRPAPQVQQLITINQSPQTMTVSPTQLSAGSTGNTLTFTYTAGGTVSSGQLTLAVPTGWPSAPSTTSTKAGYVTSTCGTLGLKGRTIVITGVTLTTAQSCTITYGSTAGGGTGAAAPTATGISTFTASEASTSSGTPVPLATSPAVTVYAANGSGTMTVSPTTLARRPRATPSRSLTPLQREA